MIKGGTRSGEERNENDQRGDPTEGEERGQEQSEREEEHREGRHVMEKENQRMQKQLRCKTKDGTGGADPI